MADQDSVLAELENLKQRLDASLAGLTHRHEHTPMHEIVGFLINHIVDQHAQIRALKAEIADLKAARG